MSGLQKLNKETRCNPTTLQSAIYPRDENYVCTQRFSTDAHGGQQDPQQTKGKSEHPSADEWTNCVQACNEITLVYEGNAML